MKYSRVTTNKNVIHISPRSSFKSLTAGFQEYIQSSVYCSNFYQLLMMNVVLKLPSISCSNDQCYFVDYYAIFFRLFVYCMISTKHGRLTRPRELYIAHR